MLHRGEGKGPVGGDKPDGPAFRAPLASLAALNLRFRSSNPSIYSNAKTDKGKSGMCGPFRVAASPPGTSTPLRASLKTAQPTGHKQVPRGSRY